MSSNPAPARCLPYPGSESTNDGVRILPEYVQAITIATASLTNHSLKILYSSQLVSSPQSSPKCWSWNSEPPDTRPAWLRYFGHWPISPNFNLDETKLLSNYDSDSAEYSTTKTSLGTNRTFFNSSRASSYKVNFTAQSILLRPIRHPFPAQAN